MSDVRVFDDVQCSLGEGPLWHPKRGQFFWFDINNHRLYSRRGNERLTWDFDDCATAAGWIDENRLLIAEGGALVDFNLESGAKVKVCDLEADNPVTRPNDGRADPYGGFWIGTMGRNKEVDAGAIYRYWRGEMRQLFSPWSIPNCISFSPDGGHAYFTDTPKGIVWRQRLDGQGWPSGEPVEFLNLPAERYRPDGAVVDADGNLWCAHYSHAKVTQFSPDGVLLREITFPASRTTCPAFGGAQLSTLYVTSATQQLDAPTEYDGCTFEVEVDARGQEEHQIIL